MRYSVYQVVGWFLGPLPPVQKMRGNPEYNNWAEDLVWLGKTPGLEEMENVIQAITANAFTSIDPINRFSENTASTLSLETFLKIGEVAEEAADERAEAAFLLAILAFLGWGAKLGEHWDRRPHTNDSYYRCWTNLPYTLASISTRLGAPVPARRLMEVSFDVLNQMTTRYFWNSALFAEMDRQRALYQRILRKIEIAIVNLADDLRASCRLTQPNFRAEVGSLLWTMGLHPTSKLFRRGSDFIPSRRLCTLIVRQSLEAMSIDPLLQYIWLSLKDRPPIDLRSHEELFSVINARYESEYVRPWFFMFNPDKVFRQYVHVLTSWMRGDLSPSECNQYLNLVAQLSQSSNRFGTELIDARMQDLGYIMGFETAQIQGVSEDEVWQGKAESYSNFRKALNSHPEIPDCRGRMNLPFFMLVERKLNEAGGKLGREDIEGLFSTLERFRTGALAYWIRVNAHYPSKSEMEELDPKLLDEEDRLLEQLRGAYLLVLQPLLPMHFLIRETSLQDVLTPRHTGFNPDTGRREYEEIHDDLMQLYERISQHAPEYAHQRKELVANLADLKRTLVKHRE